MKVCNDHTGRLLDFYDRYAPDLLRDRFYLRLEAKNWPIIYLAHVTLFFVVGLAIGWYASGEYFWGIQLGSSLLIWGVFVRTVLQ